MRCGRTGRPQVAVARDTHTGRVEEADTESPDAGLRLRALLRRRLGIRAEAQGGGMQTGRDADRRGRRGRGFDADRRHPAVLAVNALLWSRGFEPAPRVIGDIEVEVFDWTEADGLISVPMCASCHAATRGAREVHGTLRPSRIPEPQAPSDSGDQNGSRAPGAPSIWEPAGGPGHVSPPELVRLARLVDLERGGTAVYLFSRDPSLTPPASLATFLTDPPARLLGDVDGEGSGFLRATHAPTVDQLEQINAAAARIVLRLVLTHHLAYSDPILDTGRGDELAAAILAFADPDARWWTNSELAAHDDHLRRVRPIEGGWQPLTEATFDAGVVGIGRDHILLAWALDED